jgi:hypothetical protein
VKLALHLESERIVAGGRCAGRVEVLEGGAARSLSLSLTFYERSGDYTSIPFTSSHVVHEGDLTTGRLFDFSFGMPAEAPPSFKGEHSELVWELDLKCDESGFDTHVNRRLEVVSG